jgi:predicted nucleic acid-binding protein
MDRQAETEDFWKRLDEFDVCASELTRQELIQTSDQKLRSKYEALLKGITIHPMADEMKELAQQYLDAGVFTSAMFNDALHVAAAVITNQAVLISWNFKHLVNRRRRAMINQVNVSNGFPMIEIVAPAEV